MYFFQPSAPQTGIGIKKESVEPNPVYLKEGCDVGLKYHRRSTYPHTRIGRGTMNASIDSLI